MENTVIENNSGNGAQTQVPAEIAKGFNWGACLMTWIWGIGNKTWITLASLAVCLVPFIGILAYIGLMVWFGMKGNEWAWQNKRWESVEHFRRVQGTWAKVAIILTVVGLAFSIFTLIASLIGVAALSQQ